MKLQPAARVSYWLMWRKVQNDRWWLFLHFFYLLYRWHIILGEIWCAIRRVLFLLFLVNRSRANRLLQVASSWLQYKPDRLLILPYRQRSKISRFPKTIFSFKFNTLNMQANLKTNTKCQTSCLSVHMQYCYCMCSAGFTGWVLFALHKVHLELWGQPIKNGNQTTAVVFRFFLMWWRESRCLDIVEKVNCGLASRDVQWMPFRG